MTAADFAINWVLANPIVTAVLAGPRTLDQWKGYLSALDHGFDGDDETLLDSLVAPGHPSTPGYSDPSYPLTGRPVRSEEHTSELQSLMRISYAVFCLKKKTKKNTTRIWRGVHAQFSTAPDLSRSGIGITHAQSTTGNAKLQTDARDGVQHHKSGQPYQE